MKLLIKHLQERRNLFMNTSKMNNEHNDLIKRMIRIESRLVRGFEEIGVDLSVEEDWLTVNNERTEVQVTSLGRSLMVMLKTMKENGANRFGQAYDIIYKDELIGSIIL